MDCEPFSIPWPTRVACSCFIALGVACTFWTTGCATAPSPAPETETRSIGPITIEIESGPIGIAIRTIAEVSAQGLVLMKGLELAHSGPYAFKEKSLETIVGHIAGNLGYGVQREKDYFFLYAPGYEVLAEPPLENRLSDSASTRVADLAFGADTPLYGALGLLGRTLGYTIVGDNAIASALSGEVHLRGVPLETALSALLQSARISAASVRVESTAEYTLLTSAANVTPALLLLNGDRDNEVQRRLLGRRTNVSLLFPEETTGHFVGRTGASTLGDVLPMLSQQLGVRITADARMMGLPVNPTAMTDVTIETALKLLIRQWLVPDFGYEIRNDAIHLRPISPR